MIFQNGKPAVVKFILTCFGCPTAWEGTTACGKELYIRYRWGCLSAYVDDNQCFFNLIDDDRLDGIMDTEEMMEHLSHVFDFNPVGNNSHIV